MRLRFFVVSCVVVLGGSSPCLAQSPTGPATLENLLTDDVAAPAQRPTAVDATAPAAANPLPSGRIQGAVTRPKDGVQHPDLDKAWADYDARIETATNAVEEAIEQALNAAAAAGDLDAALKWKTAGEQFKKNGKLPEGLGRGKTEGRPKPTPQKPEASPQSLIADAQKQLAAAYEAVEKSLVKSHDLEQAKRVRSEREALKARDEKGALVNHPRDKIFLSDLPEQGVMIGFGEFGKNGRLGFEGRDIIVRGVASPKGISMHAMERGVAKVTYMVPVGVNRFEAIAAVNDSAGAVNVTPLVFRVHGDGKLLWESPRLRGGGSKAECSIAIDDAKEITLTVECRGAGQGAHSVWCEPRFLTK